MSASPWGTTLAVIFTDIAGSTDMMFRLGTERYDGIRRRHLADLREVLAEYGGREVKGLGDGIMAVVDSAAGAVAAAVAMQQRTAAQSAAAGVDLQIRVGVSIGDAVEEEGDFYGAAVVEAARLCAAAPDSHIWVAAVVLAMASDRLEAVTEPVGPKTLKGIPTPVEVVDVAWADGTAGPTFSRPSMLSGQGQFTLVGRQAERAAALSAWETAAGGTRRLLLVGGEPGVGKSRLLAEVAATVHANGFRVLTGRCDRQGGGPLQPFVLALRHHVDEQLGRGARPDLGAAAGVLAPLLPELADPAGGEHAVGTGDVGADRLVLFDAVSDALHRVAMSGPTMLVIEDAHWAAEETIQLLRHLVGWPRQAPLLVAVTYRSTEVEPGSELSRFVAESARLWGADRLLLEGLDDLATLELVRQATGDAAVLDGVGPRVASALRRQTNGNALYTTQLLAHLVDTGGLTGFGTEAEASTEMPRSVRDLVLERIDVSGSDISRMLELAAVVGERFDPLLLEQVDSMDGRLLDAIERAVDLRLLEPIHGTMHFRFVHAVVRAAVYERVSVLRRTRVHDALADRLLATPGTEPALVAYHACEAAILGPTQAARAVTAATRAGRAALAAFEHVSAARWFAAAVASVPPDDGATRVRLLVELAEAQRNGGLAEFRETFFEAGRLARELGLLDLEVVCAIENTRGSFASGRRVDAERVAVLRDVLERVGADAAEARSRLLSNLAMELVVGPGIEERQRLTDEAVQLARSTGDPGVLAWVLARREVAMVHITTIGLRRDGLAELLEVAERQPDEALRLHAWRHDARMGLETGDLARVEQGLERVQREVDRLRQPQFRMWWARLVGTYASMRGDFAEAERAAFEARDLDREVRSPDADTTFASQFFSIRFLQGRLAEFVPLMASAKRENWLPSIWAGWSMLNAEIGDVDEAQRSLDIQRGLDFWDYPSGHTATSGIAAASLAAARVGDPELAGRLLPVLDAAAGCCIADTCYFYGPVAHHQGVLRAITGDIDQAATHLRDAVAMERALGASPWLARSLAELARVAQVRGDAAAAVAAAAEAQRLAHEFTIGGIDTLVAEPVPGA